MQEPLVRFLVACMVSSFILVPVGYLLINTFNVAGVGPFIALIYIMWRFILKMAQKER